MPKITVIQLLLTLALLRVIHGVILIQNMQVEDLVFFGSLYCVYSGSKISHSQIGKKKRVRTMIIATGVIGLLITFPSALDSFYRDVLLLWGRPGS